MYEIIGWRCARRTRSRGGASRARHALVPIGARARRRKAQVRASKNSSHASTRPRVPIPGPANTPCGPVRTPTRSRLGAARSARARADLRRPRSARTIPGSNSSGPPDGRGVQFSLFGLAGLTASAVGRLRSEPPGLSFGIILSIPRSSCLCVAASPGARVCVENRRSRRAQARSLARPSLSVTRVIRAHYNGGRERRSPSAREVLLVGSVRSEDSQEVFPPWGRSSRRMKRIRTRRPGRGRRGLSRLASCSRQSSFEDDPQEVAAGGPHHPSHRGTRTWRARPSLPRRDRRRACASTRCVRRESSASEGSVIRARDSPFKGPCACAIQGVVPSTCVFRFAADHRGVSECTPRLRAPRRGADLSRQLFREVDEICETVRHKDLAIQWTSRPRWANGEGVPPRVFPDVEDGRHRAPRTTLQPRSARR